MVEAIGAAWRERPSSVEQDDALCGFNAHAVHTRPRLRPQRVVRIMQRARTLLWRDRLRNRCKQRRKRNQNRQKDESSHIQAHALSSTAATTPSRWGPRSWLFADAGLSSRAATLSQWG